MADLVECPRCAGAVQTITQGETTYELVCEVCDESQSCAPADAAAFTLKTLGIHRTILTYTMTSELALAPPPVPPPDKLELVRCPACGGNDVGCYDCEGDGWFPEYGDDADDDYGGGIKNWTRCKRCDGDGTHPCTVCDGSGILPAEDAAAWVLERQP